MNSVESASAHSSGPQLGQWARTRRERLDRRSSGMTDPTDLTRRTVLTLGSIGAVGGALALAACTPDAPTEGSSATLSPTLADETPVPELTPAPDAPHLGDDIAALADVPVGGSIDATINGEPALIA